MKKIINFSKRNIKLIMIVLLIILVLILFPIILDIFIFGNTFPSSINNSDWASFLGGYIGAIISGVVSLVGIILTIKYTDKQNKEDRELQVRPYCSIKYYENVKDKKGLNELDRYELFLGRCFENEQLIYGMLHIKNLGLGSIIDFKIDAYEIEDKQINSQISGVQLKSLDGMSCLQVIIYLYFKPLEEDIDTDIKSIENIKYEEMNNYKSFDVKIRLKFYDIYRNEFTQILKFYINLNRYKNKGEKIQREFSMHLSDVGIIEKIKGVII